MRFHITMAASTFAVIGLAASIATTTASAAPSPESVNRAAVTLTAEGILHVNVPAGLIRYQGEYFTDDQITNLNTVGRARFGDVRVESGSLVAEAFDSFAELSAYEASKGAKAVDPAYPADETPQQRAVRLIVSGEDPNLVASATRTRTAASIGAYSMISGCTALTYGSRDYDDADCGGAYLASFPTDAIAWHGDYGHNDKMTSLDIENNGAGCVVLRTLNNNVNYNTAAGVWRYYGTPYQGTSLNLPSTQNDRVSSSKSQCS